MNKYRVTADSGSTKTDWVIVDDHGKVVDGVKTIGFNPYFQSSEFVFAEVRKGFENSVVHPGDITEVNFYGAGCSSEEKCTIVSHGLRSYFSEAVIRVEHDLKGAARATLGNEDGIAGIIGTGSNSCVWVNGEVIHNIPSHGYIFGDEGSGSYLGIRLLKLYLEDKLGKILTEDFERQFKLTKDQILNATYKENDPNVFLASFAVFFHNHMDYAPFREIMKQGFREFFEKRVIPYPNYKSYELGFVGSIAFYYQDILNEVARSHDMTVKNVVRCPIDALVEYHNQNKVLDTI